MRVAAISDTHGRQNWEIPGCDVFIHAGDMTAQGSLRETAAFAVRLRQAMEGPGGPAHAIIVPGNHDECFETFPEAARGLFGANVHVLLDEALELDGVTFYGSPWTPPFMLWHFMAEEDRLAMLYRKMPMRVDVLVTHGPPHGILDPGWKEPHAGSTALAQAVAERHVGHRVFGHLHGAGGHMIQKGNTIFYNVAGCDEAYKLVNPPRVFQVERVTEDIS
jgi:Icc-related predicted phosphoesterase